MTVIEADNRSHAIIRSTISHSNKKSKFLMKEFLQKKKKNVLSFFNPQGLSAVRVLNGNARYFYLGFLHGPYIFQGDCKFCGISVTLFPERPRLNRNRNLNKKKHVFLSILKNRKHVPIYWYSEKLEMRSTVYIYRNSIFG